MALEVCAACSTRYAVGAPRCPHCGSTERADADVGAVPPIVTVECFPGPCPRQGAARRVVLRLAAPGVVELPRLLCAVCGRELLITWPGPDTTEENTDVPKITRHGGASNAAAPAAAADQPEAETPEPEAVTEAQPDQAEPEGGEESSPGTSSSTSSEKPSTSPETKPPARPSRARATASRSKKAQTGASSASSTAGEKAADMSAADADGE